MPALLLPTVLVPLGLGGCGLLSEPPPEPEPLPLILPAWVEGEWTGLRSYDGRLVARYACTEGPEVLEVLDGARLRWRRGEQVLLDVQATDVRMQPDASVRLELPEGAHLSLVDEEEFMLVGGDRPAGSEARRFGRLGALPQVEAVVEPCGALPAAELAPYAGAWNIDGDPCGPPALSLTVDGAPPTLARAGGSWPLRAARVDDDGAWLAVEDRGGELHGVWLRRDGDRLEVRQRSDAGGLTRMVLDPVTGTCGR